MNHLGNKYLNLNFLNEKLDNHFIIETNINNDLENSDKAFSFEEKQICMPHLIEKFSCFKPEKNDKIKVIVDDKNNIALNKGKSPKKNIDEDETFDAKTIYIEKKNKLGRKRKGENYDNNNEEHDKFSNDNITRKVKRIIFTHLLKYLNKQIKIKYNGKIGKGVFKKELYLLNQSQILNSCANFNNVLLQKTLYDIFSDIQIV